MFDKVLNTPFCLLPRPRMQVSARNIMSPSQLAWTYRNFETTAIHLCYTNNQMKKRLAMHSIMRGEKGQWWENNTEWKIYRKRSI